jgi:hypothetical protein
MLKNILYTLIGVSFYITCLGQSNLLTITKHLKLPADSVQIISSLNGFLRQITKPDKDNAFISKDNFVTTAALVDEMKGMENEGPTKINLYKCYLTNVVPLDSTGYIIQLSWLGTDEGTPVLKASFKLIAQKQGGQYVFSSPLKRNTLTWLVKKTGNFTVYRNTSAKVDKLDEYISKAAEYDKRINAPNYPTKIYYCDNFEDMLELMGVTYKLNYNSLGHGDLGTFEDNHSLYLIGAPATDLTAFDPHDLWHSRLHHVVSTDIINRPVDEACAYLYGGSWGIMKWPDIFKKFKDNMGADHDWLAVFNSHKKFGDAKAPLYADYVIDALIVQKIEKEKSFQPVIELLSCGKKEADNENFFKALDKIAGINRSNFNTIIDKLVAAESTKQ